MEDQQKHLHETAEESLETFELIAEAAKQKLAEHSGGSPESLAVVNTMTSSSAVDNLRKINEANREGYRALLSEPAISRVVAADDEGNTHTYYVSRRSSIPSWR